MYKVHVSIPAPLTSLTPGLHTLGLSLTMHVQIEMMVRRDDVTEVTMHGYGKDELPAGLRNPVVRAATKLFQLKEMAPAGLTVLIDNAIPLNIGLDVEAALLVGGLVAANNLTGGELHRDDLLNMAIQMGVDSASAVTALLGGLNFCFQDGDGQLVYSSLEPPPLRIAFVVPTLPDYADQTANVLPEVVPLEDAVYNMSRLPFMIDALLSANFKLLERAMQDRLYVAQYIAYIPGFDSAKQAALENGADLITLAGKGPALLAFAKYNHTLIANSMADAFQKAGVEECRYWTLTIDGQGVTVSVAE